MNIIEALKSGKPFKRKNNYEWFTPENIEKYTFNWENISHDDWEVNEEEPKDELKPCAHCGSGDVTLAEKEPDFGDRNSFFVICQCGIRTVYYTILKDAIAAWNRRVESSELSQFREQIKLRDEALVELRKEYDNDHRKAYHAGISEVTSKSISNITTRGIDSYDEWKRGQK